MIYRIFVVTMLLVSAIGCDNGVYERHRAQRAKQRLFDLGKTLQDFVDEGGTVDLKQAVASQTNFKNCNFATRRSATLAENELIFLFETKTSKSEGLHIVHVYSVSDSNCHLLLLSPSLDVDELIASQSRFARWLKSESPPMNLYKFLASDE